MPLWAEPLDSVCAAPRDCLTGQRNQASTLRFQVRDDQRIESIPLSWGGGMEERHVC